MSVRDGGRACYVGIASATTKAEVPKLVLEDVFFRLRCVFDDGDVSLCFTVRLPFPSILSKSNVYFEVLFLFFLGDIGVFHYFQPIVVKSRNRTELDYTAGESNINRVDGLFRSMGLGYSIKLQPCWLLGVWWYSEVRSP